MDASASQRSALELLLVNPLLCAEPETEVINPWPSCSVRADWWEQLPMDDALEVGDYLGFDPLAPLYAETYHSLGCAAPFDPFDRRYYIENLGAHIFILCNENPCPGNPLYDELPDWVRAWFVSYLRVQGVSI